MRKSIGIVSSLLVLASCNDPPDIGFGGSEIVFGIEQHTTKEVTVGYEYLQLVGQRGGWAPYVFRDGDGDGTCYFERFADRLGRLHVEGGKATFSGGKLAPPGISVLANQPDLTRVAGAGWTDGDLLSFSAEGFAMPGIADVRFLAPRASVEIASVTPALADGATDLVIKATDDVTVSWKPVTDGPPSQMMVALDTDDGDVPGSQVRCFTSLARSSLVIPKVWVGRLFGAVDVDKPLRGKLEIATHHQVTVLSHGIWTVYVVASSSQREQPWTGVR